MADAKPQSDHDLDELARRFHDGEAPAVVASGSAATSAGANADASRDGLADDELSIEELKRTALGQRLARRRGYAVSAREQKTRHLLSAWGLAGVMLLAAWSVGSLLPEIRYWTSSATPIDLGHVGGYQLDQARDGAFARVEGIASPTRGHYSSMFSEHELFPLMASRILVDRARAPDESLRGFGFRYAGDGRLVRAEAGSKWDTIRRQFTDASELSRTGDIWVLEDGVSPRRGWRTPVEVGFWSALFLSCAVTLALRARTRLGAVQS